MVSSFRTGGVKVPVIFIQYYDNESNTLLPNSYLQYSAASYSLGSESTGTVKSSTGTPSVDAKSFIRFSFGVRISLSYWAIRTSAQLSGNPTAMPSSFWVRWFFCLNNWRIHRMRFKRKKSHDHEEKWKWNTLADKVYYRFKMESTLLFFLIWNSSEEQVENL